MSFQMMDPTTQNTTKIAELEEEILRLGRMLSVAQKATLAVGRQAGIKPKDMAQVLSQEQANDKYYQAVTAELDKINAKKAQQFKKNYKEADGKK